MIDDADARLLHALRDNARASLTELAGRLGMSRATVKTRLERLVATGKIRRFTIETDLDERETVRAVMVIELEGAVARSVIRQIKGLPGIADLHMTSGSWDLIAMIEVESLAEFDRVLRQVREVRGVLNSQTSLLLNRE